MKKRILISVLYFIGVVFVYIVFYTTKDKAFLSLRIEEILVYSVISVVGFLVYLTYDYFFKIKK